MRHYESEPYPYVSNYLYDILENKDQNVKIFPEIINQIQKWLTKNVKHYAWSNNNISIFTTKWQKYPESISFCYEEDLLAFRLVWGVNA